MTDTRLSTADANCCPTCKWASEQTGLTGSSALNRPWLIRQVKTLIDGDVLREWGAGPHLKATVSVRDDQVVAVWDDGTERELADRNGSVLTMERSRA